MVQDWDGLLHAIAPRGRDDILEGMSDAMPTVCQHIQLNTPERLAHALSQGFVESAGFTRLEENLNYSARRLKQVFPRYFDDEHPAEEYAGHPQLIANRVYGGRLGNKPGTNDGWDYRGGGILQNTGRENYRKAGYEDKPDDLRKMPGALIAFAEYWLRRKCNAAADTGSVLAVTRLVNGGTNGLAERQAAYKRILPLVRKFWDAEIQEGEEAEEVSLLAPVAPKKKVLSKAQIVGLQKRLKEIGYNEVGTVDGLWGGKTRGALAAFQTDAGIRPVTGQTDDETMRRISEPFERPVSEARLATTTVSLAQEGNVAAKQTLQQKAGAWFLGVGGSVMAAVKGAADYFSDAKDQVTSWAGHFDSVPLWVVLLVAGGLAYWWWYSADKAGKDLVAAKKDGRLA